MPTPSSSTHFNKMLQLPGLGGAQFLQDTDFVHCRSCNLEHLRQDAWFCQECYDKFGQAAQGLKQGIENLEAKNSFLSSWMVFDHHDPPSARSVGPGFADVLLVAVEDDRDGVSSTPVPAHRFILASRSRVFKAMLETDMEESHSGIIKISGMSSDVLQAFVKYMYTAEACLNEQVAGKLLALAEMYEVMPLKEYSEKFLVSTSNWENSLSNYAIAHKQGAKILLEAALSIIFDNMGKFPKHPMYPKLNELLLTSKIYEAFLVKQQGVIAALEDHADE